ncbi:hypothetical protein [Mesorhizobium sp. CAU 1741]|uniref:hypothetical protein n=1 Tax=Mesorhizobium sp. CAU 1741 TaxID=3140366 RepID=UPI00325A5957
MKTVLALAAALGLSVSAASAACSGYVSASVDKELTVASISTPADDAKPTVEEKEAE